MDPKDAVEDDAKALGYGVGFEIGASPLGACLRQAHVAFSVRLTTPLTVFWPQGCMAFNSGGSIIMDWASLPATAVATIGAFLCILDNIQSGLVCKRWRDAMDTVPFTESALFHIHTHEDSYNAIRFMRAHKSQFTSIDILYDCEILPIPDAISINSMLNTLIDYTGVSALKLLSIVSNHITAPLIMDMSRFPHFPQLKTLYLMPCSEFVGDLQDFCEYYSSRLVNLSMRSLPAAVGSTWDPTHSWLQLNVLDVAESDTPILMPIISTQFDKLDRIDFSHTGMGNAEFAALVRSDRFMQYKVLDLMRNNIGDEGMEALEELYVPGVFDSLEVLALSQNPLGDRSLEILADLPHGSFAHLTHLWLGGITPSNVLLQAEWLDNMYIEVGEIEDAEEKQHFETNLAKRGCRLSFSHV